MIKGIKFASVPTTDQDRALRFWTEQMGFAVHTDQPFDEHQRWIELRIKGSDTHLVLFSADGDKARIGQFQNINFYCDNIDKTYEELQAAGVDLAGPPQKTEWGAFLMFKDPDGSQFLVSTR